MGSFVMYGDEPWIMRRQKERFKSCATDVTYGYKECLDIWDAKNFLLSYNFFADKLYAYVHVEDLKSVSSKEFLSFLDAIKNDNAKFILIETDKAAKAMENKVKAVATSVNAYPKIQKKEILLKQVDVILSEQDAQMEGEAKSVLIDRLAYFDHTATNLITIENSISQLKYLSELITADDVERNTPDLREGKKFYLAGHIAKKDLKSVLLEAERLKRNAGFNAFEVLGILHKEYRVAYLSLYGYSPNVQGVYSNSMKSLSEKQLVKGMNIISDKLRDIRTGIFTEDEAFQIALTELVGNQL